MTPFRDRSDAGSGPHPDLAGPVVIIVEDGIATGATVEAAVRAIRRRGPIGPACAGLRNSA